MTRFPCLAFALVLSLAAGASVAQESDETEPGTGFNLIDEGALLLFRGLQDELKPFMEDLAIEIEPKLLEFAEEFLPLIEGYSELIGDLDEYEAPEKLPNGDIILRRKVPVEPAEPGEGSEIDL